MKFFENIPLIVRFRRAIMLTSIAVLVLTCISFIIYEYQTFRITTKSNLSTTAEIVAANSTAALAFHNREDAIEILSALKAEKYITSAKLYDNSGHLFAQYPGDMEPDTVPVFNMEPGFIFGNAYLEGYTPVVWENKQLGTLFLKYDLEVMSNRFRLYLLVLCIVVAVAIMLAHLLSRYLESGISTPLLQLSETARAISVRNDYTVRASKLDNYELGDLTDAFNHMLEQIEQRDAALSVFNKKLEEKVKERTQKIEETNRELRAAEKQIRQKYIDLGEALSALQKTEEELLRLNNELEMRVQKRTIQLEASEEALTIKNKELERTNVDLDNFVYRASHDLRSPISNIEGLAQFLRRQLELKLKPDDLKLFDMIELSLSKFRATINDLTEISKVQKDQEILEEDVRFEDVLQEVRDDIWQMLEESKAEIRTNFEVDSIYYAPYNLRSIVYNMLSNAIKYRSDQRPLVIDLTTYTSGGKVVLTVRDNGLGMSDDDLTKIFSMFKRLHAHVDGSGIGLYITKRIIENKGGRIEVESALDVGSTFRVYF